MTALSTLDLTTFDASHRSEVVLPPGALLPKVDIPLAADVPRPRLIRLRTPIAPFTGNEVTDPAAARHQRNRDDEQRSLIAQAVGLAERVPGSAALSRLAQTLLAMGHNERAAEVAHEVLAQSPTAAPDRAAEFVAARVLVSVGEKREAESFLQRFTSEYGPWTCLYAALAEDRGDHSLALERLTDAPGAEAAALRGYVYLQVGQFQTAMRELRQAGGEASADPSLLTNLAYAYAALGSTKKAIRAARQAAMIAPVNESIVINLAGHLVNAGRAAAAVAELNKYRISVGSDLKTVVPLASALLNNNDPRKAIRELRRATSAMGLDGKAIEVVEARAFLAALEWKAGLLSKGKLLKTLRTQLEATEGQSLRVATLFAGAISDSRFVPEISQIYRRLQATSVEPTLLPLKTRLLFLGERWSEAASAAQTWTAYAPLDADAAAVAILLRGLAEGNFEGASQLGLSAVQRLPGFSMVRNNTAYALALAGRGNEAAKLLESVALDEFVHLLATDGLINLSLGRIAKGLDRYAEAAERAVRETHSSAEGMELQQLVEANKVFALHYFGLEGHPEVDPSMLELKLPQGWEWNANF